MTDTIFRTKNEPQEEPQNRPTVEIDKQQISQVDLEPPYTDYPNIKNHPYLVDYYQLGDMWNDPRGGFSKEVEAIDSYLQHKIQVGEIDNSIGAVKETIKQMEKVNGINKTERITMKMEILAAYAKFLLDADKIRYSGARYG
jgi:hypothetical protein